MPEPDGAGLFFAALVVVATACAFYWIFLRFQFDALLQQDTVFGITDRWAILHTRRWIEFTPLDPKCIETIEDFSDWQALLTCRTGKSSRFHFSG